METRSEETGTGMATTVLVVDDHPVVRAGLRALVASEPGLRVVGDCGTAAEALRLGQELRPQVVLLDIRLPDLDGVEAARRLRMGPTPPRVVLLSSFVDPTLVARARRVGVSGYLLKDLAQDRLVAALVRVAAGEVVLAPEVEAILWEAPVEPHGPAPRSATGRRPLPEGCGDLGLTGREVQVMDLVTRGMVNKEIADRLGLSVGTVRNLLTSVFAKLGVSTRTEAAMRWVRRRDPR